MEPSIEFGCKFIGKNHRKIYVLFDELTKHKHYLIMIASIIVGGINTICYNEQLYNQDEYYNINLSKENLYFKKGEYLANFYIGSMVIYLHNSNNKIDTINNFSLKRQIMVGNKLHF